MVFELAFPALSAALAACVVALVLVRLFAGKADIALARRGQLALAGTAGMGEWGRAPAIQDVMGDHSVRGLGVSLIMQRISTAAALSCIAIVVFGFKVSDLGGARIIALAGFASVAALALGRATIALPALMLWIAPRFGIDMEHAWLLADLSLVAIPFATLCDGYLSLTLASALNRRADDVLLTEEIFDDADIVEELPEDLEMNQTPIAKTKEPVSRDTGSSSTQ
ncbi:MAG: hypothetical protein L6Q71_03770 [Planctomycetes bacterium]|nr:hypothetical protein [Planctomycetota bacterium]